MRTDKSAGLAAERLEPMTAAEHAAASGREAEYARDVPRTCACAWQWNAAAARYERITLNPECPWCTDAVPSGGQVTMKVGQAAYDLATAIRARLSAELGRKVTYSETLEKMAMVYEQTDQIIRDVRAGRA